MLAYADLDVAHAALATFALLVERVVRPRVQIGEYERVLAAVDHNRRPACTRAFVCTWRVPNRTCAKFSQSRALASGPGPSCRARQRALSRFRSWRPVDGDVQIFGDSTRDPVRDQVDPSNRRHAGAVCKELFRICSRPAGFPAPSVAAKLTLQRLS